MNEIRTQEIVKAILADLMSMGVGPGQNVPVRTLWLRAWKEESTRWPGQEFQAALEFGMGGDLWDVKPGGIAGMGVITLTDTGYARSRE